MSAMLKIIFLSSTSACFELDGQEPWFAPKPYTLRLNGEAAGGGDTNVFSLFRLHPGTEYHLELRFADGEMEEVRFRTPKDSMKSAPRSRRCWRESRYNKNGIQKEGGLQNGLLQHALFPYSRGSFPIWTGARTYISEHLRARHSPCINPC